jgi:hypothetical protein
MGVIKIGVGGGQTRPAHSNYAGFREKFGQYECRACHRTYNEHTNEELDKCMDEMSSHQENRSAKARNGVPHSREGVFTGRDQGPRR